jgi:hypothetical protein
MHDDPLLHLDKQLRGHRPKSGRGAGDEDACHFLSFDVRLVRIDRPPKSAFASVLLAQSQIGLLGETIASVFLGFMEGD